MPSKKRKRSARSPQPRRDLLRLAPAGNMLRQSGLDHWQLFLPVQSSLTAVQKATKQGLPDNHARAKVLREELVKLGNHVEHLASEPGMNEGDRISFW